MGRILAIDYGQKRVGIAVTDNLKIIATPLTTIHSKDIITFLKDYLSKEEVEVFVVGEAKRLNNEESDSTKFIEPFVNLLRKTFPLINIERIDERYTSKMAFQTMIDSGLKKKERKNKETVDVISATLILQTYMSLKNNLNN